MIKLKHLDVSNLGIDSDLEYLPNDIKRLICSNTKHNRYREKPQEIIEKLRNFDKPERKRAFFSCDNDFATNLEAWKDAHLQLMLKVEKEKNIELKNKNCRLLRKKKLWEKQFPRQTPQQVKEEKDQWRNKYYEAFLKLNDSRDLELQRKGYSKKSVKEIKNWNLLDRKEVYIPDLNSQERRGVVKTLSLFFDNNSPSEGCCSELIVFLVPFSSRLTLRTVINKSNLAEIDGNLQIEYSQGTAEETKQSSNKIIKSLIRDIIQNRNGDDEWKWDIYVLVNKKTIDDYNTKRNSFGHNNGISADSAFYLALTSAYLEIPLSDKVAITGTTELADLDRFLHRRQTVQIENQQYQTQIIQQQPFGIPGSSKKY